MLEGTAAAPFGVAARFPFLISSHVLRHSCGYKLANDGHDTRARRLPAGCAGLGGQSGAVIATELDAAPLGCRERWLAARRKRKAAAALAA